MKKIVKWVVAGVLLLVLVGAVVFYLTLDAIVRKTVETQATKSLDTTTTLGGASVSPLRGTVALDDLKIASPPGFAADHIFTLGDIKVAVSYGQLRQDPIRIDSISLRQPVVVLEQKDLKTNVQAMMDRLPKRDETPAASTGAEQPLRLVISTLTVENPTVVLRPGFPGLAQEIKLNLPTLTLKDVGTGEGSQNGAAIKDVVMLVLTETVSKAADSDQLPPELRQLLNVDVKQLTSRLKDQLNVQLEKVSQDLTKKLGPDLGAVLKNPKDATSNPAQSLEQGLGSLLKKDNKQPTTKPTRKK